MGGRAGGWSWAAAVAAATAMMVVGGCARTVDGSADAPIGAVVAAGSPVLTTAEPTTAEPTTAEPTTAEPSTAAAPGTSAVKRWLLPDPHGGNKIDQFNDIIGKTGTSYGLIQKQNGQEVDVVVFRVTSVQLDKGCVKTTKPQHGHFVVLKLDVELRNITSTAASDQSVDFTGHAWTPYATDGTPQTDSGTDQALACGCDRQLAFTNDFKSGKLNSGLVVLDVAAPQGTVVLTTAGIKGGWQFGYG